VVTGALIGGAIATQNQGYYYPQNQGYYPQNQGYYYPQNQGYYYPQNQGYYPQNQGYYYPAQTYSGYSDPGYVYSDAAPAAYNNGDSVAYCEQTYRSYNPATGSYLGYDGFRHACP
jgi:hypothetical protein